MDKQDLRTTLKKQTDILQRHIAKKISKMKSGVNAISNLAKYPYKFTDDKRNAPPVFRFTSIKDNWGDFYTWRKELDSHL